MKELMIEATQLTKMLATHKEHLKTQKSNTTIDFSVTENGKLYVSSVNDETKSHCQTCEHVLNVDGKDFNFSTNVLEFSKAIKMFGKESVKINVDGENIVLTSISSTAEIEEVTPELKTFEQDEQIYLSFNIENNVLLDILNKFKPFHKADGLRPNLNTIYFELDKEACTMTITATDASILMTETIKFDAETTTNFLLTEKNIDVLKKMLDKKGQTTFYTGKGSVHIETNGQILIANNSNLKYPDYRVVFPIDEPFKVTFDRKQFLELINGLKDNFDKKFKSVQLELFNNTAKITRINFKNCNSHLPKFEKTIDCDYIGDNYFVGVNLDYLLPILKTISSEKVTFEMTTPSRAIIVRDETKYILLMPVTLSK